jgi:hypothetical protein
MPILITDLKPKIEDLSPQRLTPVPLPRKDVQTRMSEIAARVSPFGYIFVYPAVDNETTVIVWQKHIEWDYPLIGKLHLEYSEDPNFSDYITVCVTDVCPFITDRLDRFKGQQMTGCYRLKLVTGTEEFSSQPFPVLGLLNYTDYRTMLKIERAEMRNHRILTKGLFLKQRQMGEPCPHCRHKLTEKPQVTNCRHCLNTGFIGGYYAPVPCDAAVDIQTTLDQVDPQVRGPINDGEIQVRMLALYQPVIQDVWCNLHTGERFRVLAVKNLVQIKTTPVVHSVQMKRIPNSDIVYSVNLR